MTDEDLVAAKLKGYNCLLKFKDGEELLLKVDEVDESGDSSSTWFYCAERFMNGYKDDALFVYPNIAVASDSVKYIIKI